MWPLITSNYNLDRPGTWGLCEPFYNNISPLVMGPSNSAGHITCKPHLDSFYWRTSELQEKESFLSNKYRNAVFPFPFRCFDTQHNKTPFMFFPVGPALADPDIVFIMPPLAPTSKTPWTRGLNLHGP